MPVAARQGLWPVLLHTMNMKAEDFIKKNQEEIFCHLLETSAENQVSSSTSDLELNQNLSVSLKPGGGCIFLRENRDFHQVIFNR